MKKWYILLIMCMSINIIKCSYDNREVAMTKNRKESREAQMKRNEQEAMAAALHEHAMQCVMSMLGMKHSDGNESGYDTDSSDRIDSEMQNKFVQVKRDRMNVLRRQNAFSKKCPGL